MKMDAVNHEMRAIRMTGFPRLKPYGDS